jgi:polyphenol oxidase
MLRTQHDDLIYYQFNLLAQFPELDHGVFTRSGGVSTGYHDSLNVSTTVGDDPANVLINRQRMASVFGLRDEDTRFTWQVHSADVLPVDRATIQTTPPPHADGIITNDPHVPLVMRFADCTPVVLYDPVQHAIGIAHAGWKGTVLGAGAATARAMIERYGSHPADIVAGIGPAIGPCCYEVGPEVVEAIHSTFKSSADLITPPQNGHGTHLNLWEANALALRDLGVEQIEIAGICTSCNREFYSHRRDQGKTGRFGVLLNLRD